MYKFEDVKVLINGVEITGFISDDMIYIKGKKPLNKIKYFDKEVNRVIKKYMSGDVKYILQRSKNSTSCFNISFYRDITDDCGDTRRDIYTSIYARSVRDFRVKFKNILKSFWR